MLRIKLKNLTLSLMPHRYVLLLVTCIAHASVTCGWMKDSAVCSVVGWGSSYPSHLSSAERELPDDFQISDSFSESAIWQPDVTLLAVQVAYDRDLEVTDLPSSPNFQQTVAASELSSKRLAGSWGWVAGLLMGGAIAAGVLYNLQRSSAHKPVWEDEILQSHEPAEVPMVTGLPLQLAEPLTEEKQASLAAQESAKVGEPLTLQRSDSDALAEITRLPKINIVDELINDLNSPDPVKRRKAIWDLGQAGDARAVQPLVDLMVDADSQQRSLILAAISEISIRSLKPIQRALITSLRDENPDVRKNAIRDATRIYDMMSQISQLLTHAIDDPDAEVQETAQWALGQLNRLRPGAPESHPAQSDPSESDASR